MKSIKNLEMQNHISELITIDNFEAKLGNDEDVSVVKLQTDNKEVAFVELERNQNLPKQIVELVRDVEQVSGMLPWRFIFHKQNKSYKLSEENLNTVIPTSASQYKFLTDENIEEDINKFFESASVITKRIKGKNVMLKKAFTKHEMIIESFDRDIQGTYKIDRESSEQASYINHWLGGGYSVVKVDDLFKITKGTKSILTKIKEL